MGKSRMGMQKNDLQRRKRMKWIQRDRRQRTGLQLESSSPSISSVPSISPPPFQPVLALSISLWLHTISDEERLQMLSNREDSSFLPTRRSQPVYNIPHLELLQSPTSFQLCPTQKRTSSLKNLIVSHCDPVHNLTRPICQAFHVASTYHSSSLALPFFH